VNVQAVIDATDDARYHRTLISVGDLLVRLWAVDPGASRSTSGGGISHL
jgi:hypothetical protein